MYESHYGISQKPFQLSPDPRFFFASKRHQQALSYLQYGIQQSEGFIVITGPIGTGKTTLAQNLLASIEASNIEAVNIVTSNLSPEDLLRQIATQLNLNVVTSNKAELLELIEQHLTVLLSHQKRALLLVDEAQNLPLETLEELRMLSNIQREHKPLLQSFLLGQEELKDLLQMPQMEQFRQRIIASCHLKPLSIGDMQRYIEHRLATVGYKDKQLFTDQCYPIMMQATQGIPRKINLLADRVLLFGYLQNLKQITADHIESVLVEMRHELSASINNDSTATAAESPFPADQTDDSKQPDSKLDSNDNASVLSQQSSLDSFNDDIDSQLKPNSSALQQLNATRSERRSNLDLRKILMRVDRYLQKNIDEKLKMNAYLDKLLEQKKMEMQSPSKASNDKDKV
ncbi:AAA family ATPase [Thalassotalea ponticola]|uniref:ExeA family protein n=1 Tax=Thalassotalea ponticola TaxID=1523392 RepID=UPI0025B5A23D|nr:AAA family ATPase [Thalassotalea ponticola]MDN3652434.1 AAA family ATPase [Thalassotalea ponticola]